MSDERNEPRCLDHDRRILTLENASKIESAEIGSLRASRHEHGTYLQRHDLQIQELAIKMSTATSQYAALLAKVEKLDSDFGSMQLSIAAQIAEVRSDLRQTTWAVGVIVGLIVTVGRALADKFM